VSYEEEDTCACVCVNLQRERERDTYMRKNVCVLISMHICHTPSTGVPRAAHAAAIAFHSSC
jgi:hypothetical protein